MQSSHGRMHSTILSMNGHPSGVERVAPKEQLRFRTLFSDDWATYCIRNQRKVARIIGPRTLTVTQPLTRDANWAYDEVRRILRA
jgi:hypothetical protein